MILIGNGRLITRNSTNEFIENGAVVCDNDVIVDVGSFSDMKKKYSDAQFVDAHGGVIMPALINMHNHIYSAFARGLAINGYNPKNFMDILDGLWWKLDRTMNLQDTYWSAQATYVDCIKNGVTTIFDHHASFGSVLGSLNQIAECSKEAGIRSCLCYEVSDRDGDEKSAASLKENEDFIKQCAAENNPMLKGMVGMHASFTINDKTMDECSRIASETNTGCHIHVAEGLTDVEDCMEKYGKPIINRLNDFGILGKKTMVVHCIHINEKEMDLIKDTDTMVVHNPESNMGNAVGCGNVPLMFKKNLMLGLGTDGYTNDMFESYKVGNIIHKHNTGNPNVGWAEIPTMLFENNPKMANRYFDKKLGVIEKGASADVIVTDYNPLTPMNSSNLGGHCVFGMNGRSVITTVAAGKILMQDRKLTTLDEDAIMAKCREQSADLWKRINK